MSLDGCDCISMDPTVDFAAMYAEFDLFVMGRKGYEAVEYPAIGETRPGS